jgi:ABC-type transport system substrate-binding protein
LIVTETYEAADEQAIQWWASLAIDPSLHNSGSLYMLGEFRLRAAEWTFHQTALGWGPHIIDKWEPGQQLHLVKNLNYFRSESGLPKFDELTFLIFPDPDAALSALIDGTCDVLDPSTRLDGHVGLLQQMRVDNQADLLIAQTMTIEWLAMLPRPHRTIEIRC